MISINYGGHISLKYYESEFIPSIIRLWAGWVTQLNALYTDVISHCNPSVRVTLLLWVLILYESSEANSLKSIPNEEIFLFILDMSDQGFEPRLPTSLWRFQCGCYAPTGKSRSSGWFIWICIDHILHINRSLIITTFQLALWYSFSHYLCCAC